MACPLGLLLRSGLMYSDPSAGFQFLVVSFIGLALFLLVLFAVIRGAVTGAMKSYALWREETGRDPKPPTTPANGS